MSAVDDVGYGGLRSMVRLVAAVTASERLSDIVARLPGPTRRRPGSEWEIVVRQAQVFGLLDVDDDEQDPTLRRTAFGDAWAADRATRCLGDDDHGSQPLPGPGRFDVEFYPLTQRPAFPVIALAGPDVATTRLGGWNLENGFTARQPNPVIEVEVRSTLHDGTAVSVQSSPNTQWVPLSALQLSNPTDFMSIADRLRSALAATTAPWQTRTADLDGHPLQMLVLDLSSPALPAGVTGPPMLAFGRPDWGLLAVVANHPGIDLVFTQIPIQDLIPDPPA